MKQRESGDEIEFYVVYSDNESLTEDKTNPIMLPLCPQAHT
jgi:hypothetical protein